METLIFFYNEGLKQLGHQFSEFVFFSFHFGLMTVLLLPFTNPRTVLYKTFI